MAFVYFAKEYVDVDKNFNVTEVVKEVFNLPSFALTGGNNANLTHEMI